MAAGEEKGEDFYAVLGLKKECSDAELRNAYKKLALRWHPDRCSASEAKKKFQAVQQAYSVLSDSSKRFLYDVGVYNSDDDDENGMCDFLNEMAVLMSQNKSTKTGGESFEELKDLFEEMFQSDIETFGSSSSNTVTPPSNSWYSYDSCSESSTATNKRNSSNINSGSLNKGNSSSFDVHFEGFCLGVEHQETRTRGKEARGGRIPRDGNRRRGRKQKMSSGHDVSSCGYSHISA